MLNVTGLCISEPIFVNKIHSLFCRIKNLTSCLMSVSNFALLVLWFLLCVLHFHTAWY